MVMGRVVQSLNMAAWKCKQKLKKPFHFSVLSLKVGWGRLIQKILIRKNEFANHRNPNSYMVRFYYSISVLYLYPLSVCVTVNLTDTESAYLHFFICIQKSRRGPTQCIFNFLSEKKFVVRKSGKRVPPQKKKPKRTNKAKPPKQTHLHRPNITKFKVNACMMN